jgi:acetylornithine/succinyldiaminopimelate/putrescine aminotransferase
MTHKAAYREPFEPLLPDVRFAPFNDLEAAAQVIDDGVCAVFVEPVQGEGGVRPATAEFLQGLRRLCDAHGALLVFDEVQCGLGRTGDLWAYQGSGVEPDLLTLAKPLAGGLPIGAILLRQAVAAEIGPGDHGSTFAAGPVVCAAACHVFDRVSEPDFLGRVAAAGERLRQGLTTALGEGATVRGRGLLVGVEVDRPVAPWIEAARQRGLLVISAGPNILRICPPLIATAEDIDAAVEILAASWREVP